MPAAGPDSLIKSGALCAFSVMMLVAVSFAVPSQGPFLISCDKDISREISSHEFFCSVENTRNQPRRLALDSVFKLDKDVRSYNIFVQQEGVWMPLNSSKNNKSRASERILFEGGESKLFRLVVNVPPQTRGKFDLFAKAHGNPEDDSILDPWLDPAWNRKLSFTLTETANVSRVDELVSVYLDLGNSGYNCSREFRVTATMETGLAGSEIEVPSRALQCNLGAGNRWAQVQFFANVSANTSRTFNLYYDNPSAPYPAYEFVGLYLNDTAEVSKIGTVWNTHTTGDEYFAWNAGGYYENSGGVQPSGYLEPTLPYQVGARSYTMEFSGLISGGGFLGPSLVNQTKTSGDYVLGVALRLFSNDYPGLGKVYNGTGNVTDVPYSDGSWRQFRVAYNGINLYVWNGSSSQLANNASWTLVSNSTVGGLSSTPVPVFWSYRAAGGTQRVANILVSAGMTYPVPLVVSASASQTLAQYIAAGGVVSGASTTSGWSEMDYLKAIFVLVLLLLVVSSR